MSEKNSELPGCGALIGFFIVSWILLAILTDNAGLSITISVCLSLILGVLLAVVNLNESDRKKAEKERSKQLLIKAQQVMENGLSKLNCESLPPIYYIDRFKPLCLALTDNNHTLVVGTTESNPKNDELEFSYKKFQRGEIISAELKENGFTVAASKDSNKMIKNAALGGILAGHAGAVVGALSTNNNPSSESINSLRLYYQRKILRCPWSQSNFFQSLSTLLHSAILVINKRQSYGWRGPFC